MSSRDDDLKKTQAQQPTEKDESPRRKLLKTLAAGGVAGAALPATWSKPAIDSVMLPAHAQTTGPIVTGGGGSGGTGPGPAPRNSIGDELMDFFVNPAQAGDGFKSFCVELQVRHSNGDPVEVTVTKYCYDECDEGRFYNQTGSSVSLTKSGDKWTGTVDGFPMNVRQIDVFGVQLALVTWNSVEGIIFVGGSCDCTCSMKEME